MGCIPRSMYYWNNMIRKITEKIVASPMNHLKDDNGTLITDRVEIANALCAAIEKSLSSNNYSKEFQSIKAQKEKQKINFKTNRNLRYNKKFTMRDLKWSLKKSIFISWPRSDPFWNFTPPFYWDSPYIIGHHKWNMEKWHISGIMGRGSDCFNSQTRRGSF